MSEELLAQKFTTKEIDLLMENNSFIGTLIDVVAALKQIKIN